MTTHPHHDLVAAEVRSWYTDWPGRGPGPAGSIPDIGVRTEVAPYGYLRDGPGAAGRRVVLTVDEPESLTKALDAARTYFGTDQFDVWIDEPERASRLEPGLTTAGFHAPDATVVLALIGPLSHSSGPSDLRIAEVGDEEGLRAWAEIKLEGFADGQEPEAGEVEAELESRRAEWPISRYEIASVGDERVATLAHYTASSDQMVFSLTTLVPFRHRGIAQAMLAHWAGRAVAQGARSLLINCYEHGRPAQLYRRMGFTDPVYWHRRYQRPRAESVSFD